MPMPASIIFDLHVVGESDVEFYVVADQRDMAKWEVQPFGGPITELDKIAMLGLRYLAWSAATRQRLTVLNWDEWSDWCIEAMPRDDAEAPAGDDESGDPGQTVQ